MNHTNPNPSGAAVKAPEPQVLMLLNEDGTRTPYIPKAPPPGAENRTEMEKRRDRLRMFRHVLTRMGYYEAAPPVVHVAGTNGKGSTSNLIASILTESGIPVAHNFPSGRFALSGYSAPRELPKRTVRAIDPHIWPLLLSLECTHDDRVSLHEYAVDFLCWCWPDYRPAVQVVEAGCGGGTDLTNVVRSIVSVITNVTLDHTGLLGETVEEIAEEKAGIMRPGVPALTAAEDPAALAVLRRRAAEVGTTLHELDRSRILEARTALSGTYVRLLTDAWGELVLQSPLVGVHQIGNIALAVRAVELLPPDLRPTAEAVRLGVGGARWPGRCQVLYMGGVTTILDGAHNDDGARVLAETIETVNAPGPRVAVLACLARKDGEAIVRQISKAVDRLVLTTFGAKGEEPSWDLEAMIAHSACPAEIVPDFHSALRHAFAAATPGGTVVIAGSLITARDGLLALTGLTFG